MKSGRLVLVAVLCAIGCMSTLDAQRTTRRGLKTDRTRKVETAVAEYDTLRLPGDIIKVSGYEKPLNSSRESFHITNDGDLDIIEVAAVVSYFDYQGNELHKRETAIRADIPARSTRLVNFPSWDAQRRFYYVGGPRPRNQAYPYDVTIEIIHVITK